jgi:hypothetical protein
MEVVGFGLYVLSELTQVVLMGAATIALLAYSWNAFD